MRIYDTHPKTENSRETKRTRKRKEIIHRAIANFSSCRVNAISRRGIVQPGSSSGSIFLLFSMKVAGENPRPPALCDSPTEMKKKT